MNQLSTTLSDQFINPISAKFFLVTASRSGDWQLIHKFVTFIIVKTTFQIFTWFLENFKYFQAIILINRLSPNCSFISGWLLPLCLWHSVVSNIWRPSGFYAWNCFLEHLIYLTMQNNALIESKWKIQHNLINHSFFLQIWFWYGWVSIGAYSLYYLFTHL